MTPLEQTQLDCEERARRIEKQWKELPASFAEFTARLASVMLWNKGGVDGRTREARVKAARSQRPGSTYHD